MGSYAVPGVDDGELAIGCWAEHEDGSLILVEGFEGPDVIYAIFDISVMPIVSYRHRTNKEKFEKFFSYGATSQSKIKWLWHDKTSFPWAVVVRRTDLKNRPLNMGGNLSAAHKVAKQLKIKGEKLSIREFDHKAMKRVKGIKTQLSDALNNLEKLLK